MDPAACRRAGVHFFCHPTDGHLECIALIRIRLRGVRLVSDAHRWLVAAIVETVYAFPVGCCFLVCRDQTLARSVCCQSPSTDAPRVLQQRAAASLRSSSRLSAVGCALQYGWAGCGHTQRSSACTSVLRRSLSRFVTAVRSFIQPGGGKVSTGYDGPDNSALPTQFVRSFSVCGRSSVCRRRRRAVYGRIMFSDLCRHRCHGDCY
jgi:hypothetical protein